MPVDVISGQVAMPVPAAAPSVIDDARAALLSMGFSPQETDVALSGYDGRICVSRICSARRLSDSEWMRDVGSR